MISLGHENYGQASSTGEDREDRTVERRAEVLPPARTKNDSEGVTVAVVLPRLYFFGSGQMKALVVG